MNVRTQILFSGLLWVHVNIYTTDRAWLGIWVTDNALPERHRNSDMTSVMSSESVFWVIWTSFLQRTFQICILRSCRSIDAWIWISLFALLWGYSFIYRIDRLSHLILFCNSLIWRHRDSGIICLMSWGSDVYDFSYPVFRRISRILLWSQDRENPDNSDYLLPYNRSSSSGKIACFSAYILICRNPYSADKYQRKALVRLWSRFCYIYFLSFHTYCHQNVLYHTGQTPVFTENPNVQKKPWRNHSFSLSVICPLSLYPFRNMDYRPSRWIFPIIVLRCLGISPYNRHYCSDPFYSSCGAS